MRRKAKASKEHGGHYARLLIVVEMRAEIWLPPPGGVNALGHRHRGSMRGRLTTHLELDTVSVTRDSDSQRLCVPWRTSQVSADRTVMRRHSVMSSRMVTLTSSYSTAQDSSLTVHGTD